MFRKPEIAPWRDKHSYLVSGPSRSGTSMMMRALEASGMPVDYDIALDEIFEMRDKLRGDYDPNPNGFYEGGEMRQGFAVKRVAPLLHTIKCYVPIRMIWMERPEAERVASIKRWCFSDEHVEKLKMGAEHLLGFMVAQSKYGLDIKTVKYADMLSNPKDVLSGLKASGWPISDIAAGAKVPDFVLYRNRANAENIPAMR